MTKSIRTSLLSGGLTALLAVSPGPGGPAAAEPRALSQGIARAVLAKLSIPFVANRGQFERGVRYSADFFCGTLDVTGESLVWSLHKVKGGSGLKFPGFGAREEIPSPMPQVETAGFRETFLDGAGRPLPLSARGKEESPTRVSYFVGNDPMEWRADIPSFERVSLGEVWPGIRVELAASEGNVEKVFTCAPGTDPGLIRVGVEGARPLALSPEGGLLLGMEAGEMGLTAPRAFQERDGIREPVPVAYALEGRNSYGFRILGPYDAARPLVIDPALQVLLASTYLGTDLDDRVTSLALDSKGNLIGAGHKFDQKKRKYLGLVFKLKGDLSALLAMTYIGGDKTGTGFAINAVGALALGLSGDVYLAGHTNCPDFPTTAGAYDTTPNGSQDVFVLRLGGGLNKIFASTLIGAAYWESAYGLALDAAGNVYVTGTTASAHFPTTPAAYDTTYNGHSDVFISKFNRPLTKLLASTFLGGTSHNPEEGLSCSISRSGDLYICGWTFSADFPTTAGAYDRRQNGYGDVFVARLDPTLSNLVASTFLGGRENESAEAMVLDGRGNVYLAGWTESQNFPATPGAYDMTLNDAGPDSHDAFVAKLDPGLRKLIAATFLGGEVEDEALAIALNKVGNVYVAGWTCSAEFPTTPGAYDTTLKAAGVEDAFVSKFNASLSRLLVSTFLGGSGPDYARAVVINGVGDIYVAGGSSSTDFPATERAYDKTANGKIDIFVSKFRH
jgi:hypothetical protein